MKNCLNCNHYNEDWSFSIPSNLSNSILKLANKFALGLKGHTTLCESCGFRNNKIYNLKRSRLIRLYIHIDSNFSYSYYFDDNKSCLLQYDKISTKVVKLFNVNGFICYKKFLKLNKFA